MNAPNQQQKPTTAIQKKQPDSPLVNFGNYLTARKDKLQALLPQHMKADRLITVALTAFNKEPKLLACSIESTYLALRQAAEVGLEIGGALGHGYLVPMGRECTFIPGYRGLIHLARQSGEVADVYAHVVHENDKFEVTLGYHEDIIHIPVLKGNPGEVVAAYAVAILPGGQRHLEVMTKSQLEAVKVFSKGGLAAKHWEEWCRKTVVRRLVKYLPLSPEKAEKLARALEIDNENDGTIDVEGSISQAQEKMASRTEALMSKVNRLKVKTVAEQEGQDVVDVAPEPEPSIEEPTDPASSDEPPAGMELPKMSDQVNPKK